MKAQAGPAAGSGPLAVALLGAGLIALIVSLGLAGPATASASKQSARNSAGCRGPASPGGFFRLVDRRKIARKRTSCAKARKVVRRFPRSCSEAYAAQGRCRVRAAGRWRCRSRIAGSLEDGAPSKQRCKRRRSKLRFEVAYFPPTEPRSSNRAALRIGPYDERRFCVDTSDPGRVIPPPDPSVGGWEIHLMRGVRRRVGEDLQSALIAHRVAAILHAGLGSQPRNHPSRIPIFVTRGDFDSDASLGTVGPTCESASVDGIVVTARQPAREIANTAAHELFHAYSLGINDEPDVPWWEESAATWSSGKLSFGEDTTFDIALQYPRPLDTWRPGFYPYAMSRFVQFLDDRGFIGDPAWTLQRRVIGGYGAPGATAALAGAIGGSSSLGAELGAFWGDRLRANPLHGPRLRPGARNATRVRVRQGTRDVTARSARLDTSVFDFRLAGNVKRVEFEFDPPAENGFFWGLVSPDVSRPFGEGESVSFCVGGGDEDDLEWPGRFPVTFTNGALAGASVTGTITINAQTSADQCTNPLLDRACRLLDRARVERILGWPGQLVPQPGFEGSNITDWNCRHQPDDLDGASASLNVTRLRRARDARRTVRGFLEADPDFGRPAYERIDIGDVGAFSRASKQVAFAVGREWFLAGAYQPNAEGSRNVISLSKPITLARRVAREVD